VARSSTEAEYRSMTHTVAELYWLRMLLKELHISLLTTPYIWVDNTTALAQSSNLVFHVRTKHIKMDYHFIREKIFNKDIQAKYISTSAQPLDIFTKGLSSSHFISLRDKLMVHDLPISLKEVVSDKPYVNLVSNRWDHVYLYLLLRFVSNRRDHDYLKIKMYV